MINVRQINKDIKENNCYNVYGYGVFGKVRIIKARIRNGQEEGKTMLNEWVSIYKTKLE